MPVVQTPSLPLAHKSYPPYDMNYYSASSSRIAKAPYVRIHTPSFDGPFPGQEFPSYDGYDDIHAPLSQWMSTGQMHPESDIFESAQCPPTFNAAQFDGGSYYSQPDDSMDSNIFSWPYDGASGYDASFSSIPEPSTFPNAFSPSVSVVSCSPRSESLSLSPQPQYHEYNSSFNFDFTNAIPQQFPSSSSSSSWSQTLTVDHSPRSSMSHSPAPSCSSIDANEHKPSSKSRDPSPSQSQAETDAQNQRRRFPCVIIGCERRFTSQYTLKVHMEAHKPKPRSSFPCTLGCSERFSRQHDRLRHEVAKHGKVCEFSCEDCGRFFSTKKTLGNHKCPVAQGGTRWVNN
ncbi:hypothetical protein JR316_0012561 [Psilocybe cubensis]|uniref:Uncharacterized protein n=2 Tax=Psilocybe cubensis TaxID=181762 RepID=A0ACB8GIB4_PSICU|nr:hypothetical protein JR316_0012561 [Psilocybe cubensis]KAH9475450.1 hypothetical protein JR316_0012561 [Psilocybe cubensis]